MSELLPESEEKFVPSKELLERIEREKKNPTPCRECGHSTPSTTASTKGELVKALKWALNMLELSNESARGFKFGWTKFFAIKAFLATPTPPSASTEGAKCQYDTDGDGNCGKPLCPVCHPENRPPASPQGADR